MSAADDIHELITQLDSTTTALGQELNAKVDQVAARIARILDQLTGEISDLKSTAHGVSARLTELGSDPENPIPPQE